MTLQNASHMLSKAGDFERKRRNNLAEVGGDWYTHTRQEVRLLDIRLTNKERMRQHDQNLKNQNEGGNLHAGNVLDRIKNFCKRR